MLHWHSRLVLVLVLVALVVFAAAGGIPDWAEQAKPSRGFKW